MRKSNVILSVVLILLVVCGWSVQLVSVVQNGMQYNAYLKQASQYKEAALYQKAILCYESALNMKDDKGIRELWIESYDEAYKDRAITINSYVAALKTMCDLYEEIKYWEILITLQMENNEPDDAYKTLQKFKKTGLSSAVISDYEQQLNYSIRVNRKTYVEFTRNATGYYTVKDSRGWGIIRPNGETVYDCMYEYIGPYNANYEALFISEKGQRIADANAVVQAKINVDYSKTGAWENYLLPVCDIDGDWDYIDCRNNEIAHGSYSFASNYQSGIAAIYDGNIWMLVDVNNKPVCPTKFSDIKLHGNNDYQFDGVMIAAVNGEYGIYNSKGELIGDVKAADMDIYLGGYIAFVDRISGKWGMATKDGDIAIEPRFVEAKSFSSNLAAVSDGEMWGFIEPAGKVVIDYQFIYADYFTDKGLCAVSLTGIDYNFIKLKYIDA